VNRIKTMMGAIVLVLAPLYAHAADLSGNWTASFDTQVGKQEYTYHFVVQGDHLTGTAKSTNGDSTLDGKVDKDTVTFTEMLNYQGQALKITYTGKIVSADEIHFTRVVADQFTEPLVAKRQAAPAKS
jgi:hypothetical protein